MERIAALSTGTKVLVPAAVLLFLSLFLTWQTAELAFGQKRQITRELDGWDFWGLLVGLLTIALIAVVVMREADDEVLVERGWFLAPVGLGALVFALVVVKKATDTGSTWASYLGVALAGIVAVGAFADWFQARSDEVPVHTAWQPQPAGQAHAPGTAAVPTADEPHTDW